MPEPGQPWALYFDRASERGDSTVVTLAGDPECRYLHFNSLFRTAPAVLDPAEVLDAIKRMSPSQRRELGGLLAEARRQSLLILPPFGRRDSLGSL